MRVFLCEFRGFSLAIPMFFVSSITPYTGEAAQTVEYNTENRNTYVSLPHLLKVPSEDIRHGIILKYINPESGELESEDTEYDTIIENKIILLTTEVKREIEIPDEGIFPIPKAFGSIYFSTLFSGIQFDSGESIETVNGPVLFLEIDTLIRDLLPNLKSGLPIRNIQKEPAA